MSTFARCIVPSILLLMLTGCSVKRMAVNRLGDALASGGSTFASDDDPELVKAAVPFSLKLMETLLAESPEHRGLLEATASGFTQFAYAFVQLEATEVRETDLARAREMEQRAKKLYLRARDYGMRGLEVAEEGFGAAFAADPVAAVARIGRRDVSLLYWTAAPWVAAISADKTDSYLISDLPKIDALVNRALELDRNFADGALHSMMISYAMVQQGLEGDAVERATRHYERAVELGGDKLAGPHVAYAESVCIPTENRDGFLTALDRALAVEIEAAPESRLENILMRDRAAWLKARVDDFFLPPLEDE